MISIFMEKMKSSKFSQIIFKDFMEFSENCIDDFLNENHDSFLEISKYCRLWSYKILIK